MRRIRRPPQPVQPEHTKRFWRSAVQVKLKAEIMKLTTVGHEPTDHTEPRVHEWRAAQLRRLGVPEVLAEIYADRIDWHQIARLVQRGCPPRLALRILR